MANTTTYKGIYAMHKYWGKKPFNEISKFIEKYTAKGEIVLDSFCGSGVTLVEALKMDRRCIGVDLNPISVKLSRVSMTAVDPEAVEAVFSSLKKELQPRINRLYEVEENGETTLVTHTIWKNHVPAEVWYATGEKKKNIRPGRDVDIEMALRPDMAPKWYPTSGMLENSRINVGKDQTVSDLFTPRALVGLSLILDEIQKIGDPKMRDVFELTFTGALSQASNLVFVIRDRKKSAKQRTEAEVGSWVIGYWVPEEHFEINVWNCFENRFKRILKGEREIYSLFSGRPEDDFLTNVTLINGTATDLPLEDDSVDYVFIDPPHTDRVLYMEQSLMWNAWLRLDQDLDWDSEIVVSTAKGRENKDLKCYHSLLSLAFSEIQRVLRPGRYFSMAFNCLDDDAWIDTLNLFVKYGFEIEDIVPLEYSATSVIQDNRKNALKTDFVLTFKNTGVRKDGQIVFADDDMLEPRIREVLLQHPEFEVYNVMNTLFEMTIPRGFVYRVSHIVKKCAEIMG